MPEKVKAAIIISISSDIGYALGRRWLAQGVKVFGTYRTYSQNVALLLEDGVPLFPCDLTERQSILNACSLLRDQCSQWDVLVLCPALRDPIAPFIGVDFDEWEKSVMVNFVGQLRVIRELLPARDVNSVPEPMVLLFAGGGPNKATVNYSAYAVSKVALIKMCELLDAELLDTRFVIVNPGWVKTKIHEAVLEVGPQAGDDYWRTAEKFNKGTWTPMERVVGCCEWLAQAPRALVSGRYFGVEFDEWGLEKLNQRLREDPNVYKLRRYE